MKVDDVQKRLEKRGYKIQYCAINWSDKCGFVVKTGRETKIFNSANKAAVYYGLI